MRPDLEQATVVWDSFAQLRGEGRLTGWLDSPMVRRVCVSEPLGAPEKTWVEAVVDELRVPRGGRWLSLGCGTAETEVALAREGLFAEMVALDAAPGARAVAERRAAEAGVTQIRFLDSDFEKPGLAEGQFDVVLMEMSLHHVHEVRGVLGSIRSCLKPEGVLLLNEFVGPRQFQFPDIQLQIVQDLLRALPERLRRDSFTHGLKSEYVRQPVEYWDAVDPTEAIRSDRILPEVANLFEVVLRLDYGGTILNLLLENVIHNFEENEADETVIRLLAESERVLLDRGVLTSDFVVLAARPRTEPLDDPEAGAAVPGGLASSDGAARTGAYLPSSRPGRQAFRGRPTDARLIGGADAGLDEDLEALRRRLEAIEMSRGWKVVQFLRTIVGRRW